VPKLICCSFPLLNSGDISGARKRAIRLSQSLGTYVDRGYAIVYSCPTCGHALKQIYPRLLGTDVARVVAQNTHFISTYLLNLRRQGQSILEFETSPLQLAYHTPCHLRSQDLSTDSLELLSLIPGSDVMHLDSGCCGMGGTWGLRSRERGAISAEIGAPLFKEIHENEIQLVATDCFGCQLQIARFTGCSVIHPARVLAQALAR